MSNAKIPLELRNVSVRRPNEDPITEKQIACITHLTGCESEAIGHLGKLQASELIENILGERDRIREISKDLTARTAEPKGASRRVLLSLIFLGVICLVIGTFFIKFEGKAPALSKLTSILKTITESAPGSTHQSEKEQDKEIGNPAKRPGGGNPAASNHSDRSVPEEAINPKDGSLRTLEGVKLPADLLVLKAIQLLDPAGKETTLPAHSEIEVLKRKEIGTLTIRYGGVIFVGNESRLRGKVRIIY